MSDTETRQDAGDGGISGSASVRRLHARLLRQVEELLRIAALPEDELRARAERVSGWAVADHLEHLTRSHGGLPGRLEKLLDPMPAPAGAARDGRSGPDGEDRKAPGIRLAGRLVLLANFIPRGAARALPSLEPRQMTTAELRSRLADLRSGLAGLAPSLGRLEKARGTFPHPVFGGLNARQWLRFIEVHHHHHLKIIRDVQRASRST